MAIQIQLRSGTTTQHNTFKGAAGELTYDTTLKSLVLHDGVTLGGVKIPYLSNGRIPSTMLPTATESVVGASKIATTAIAQAGTNDTDIITAKKLRDALNAGGNAPISACRAWVLFDGVANTILASSGVLSVARTATGLNTITLTDTVGSTKYGIFGSCRASATYPANLHTVDTTNTGLKTPSSFQIRTMVSGSDNVLVNSQEVFVGVMY